MDAGDGSTEEGVSERGDRKPQDKLHYMGTTIWVRGRNTAPEGLVEARGKVRAQLAKVRAAPDIAALIVQAKVPTRFYSVASAY